MNTRRVVFLVALVVVAGVASGCVRSSRNELAVPRGPQASPTLSTSVYYEEGDLVFLGVNAHIARFHLDKELIPVEIAIANKNLSKLTVSPEGITLRSVETGEAWPVASPSESVSQSLRSSFDRNLMPVPFTDLIRLRFPAFQYVPSTFGFRGGNWSMSRTAEMARRTWTVTQVFFPNPGGELKGKLFEVQLEAPELAQPVFTTIKF